MKKKQKTRLRIDWVGFKDNVQSYIDKHGTISNKFLCTLFNNYSEMIPISDKLAVGDKVMVVNPCSSSSNNPNDIGYIVRIKNDGYLTDFGDKNITIYLIGKSADSCESYNTWEPASALIKI